MITRYSDYIEHRRFAYDKVSSGKGTASSSGHWNIYGVGHQGLADQRHGTNRHGPHFRYLSLRKGCGAFCILVYPAGRISLPSVRYRGRLSDGVTDCSKFQMMQSGLNSCEFHHEGEEMRSVRVLCRPNQREYSNSQGSSRAHAWQPHLKSNRLGA